jgi:hypothetical protein
MLIEPLATRASLVKSDQPVPVARRAQPVAATMTDEQEGSAFMSFLGQHREFASTHRGA